MSKKEEKLILEEENQKDIKIEEEIKIPDQEIKLEEEKIIKEEKQEKKAKAKEKEIDVQPKKLARVTYSNNRGVLVAVCDGVELTLYGKKAKVGDLIEI